MSEFTLADFHSKAVNGSVGIYFFHDEEEHGPFESLTSATMSRISLGGTWGEFP